MPKLEEVFKLSGVPTVTYVQPVSYLRLLVALRTPGRGVIVEGPSGIGKTTAVHQVLKDLAPGLSITLLSARKPDDVELVREIVGMRNAGTVIIDDFHRLDETLKLRLADYLKQLADEDATDSKLVIIGINKAGDTLVRSAPDLNSRIETIRFEVNPRNKVRELIEKGEKALSIRFAEKDQFADAANGSFYLAQLLCQKACIEANIGETCAATTDVNVTFARVKAEVMDDLTRKYFDIVRNFARGGKLKRTGRAPYLHILKWLAESDSWTIDLDQEIQRHPKLRSSVSQVIEKEFLAKHYAKHKEEFSAVLHFDAEGKKLGVEDPQFMFYIRNVLWNKVAERVGFLKAELGTRYDFALSFAGTERRLAKAINDRLTENEISVFYDFEEQHLILAEDVEAYLAPIYRSEAEFVVAFLSKSYPTRIWTKFESDQFKLRFGEKTVIPIRFADVPTAFTDTISTVGGLHFDPSGDFESQLTAIVDTLQKKLADVRVARSMVPDEDDDA